jgi:Protein of unknown function (DUF1688)
VESIGAITAAAAYLLTPEAVRERAHNLLKLAKQDALPHFVYNENRLPAAIDYVLETIRSRYPTFAIPFHSRWRHFGAGGTDRWMDLSRELAADDPVERARVRFDLAATSVLLDAGAGPEWRYVEPIGATYAHSEGLAVASFHLFRTGAFSSDHRRPWRADAAALASLDLSALADGFQVSRDNPLLGLEGRLAILSRLGKALAARSDLFGTSARFGNLFDYFAVRAHAGAVSARAVLSALTGSLGDIWPGRCILGGVELGDVWRHSAARGQEATDGYVPFHKLSQWLAYSLIEPMEEAGLRVEEIDALTGLAEYRNGGLIIDIGLIEPRDAELRRQSLPVDAEPVVEWRALTVALLDRIAEGLRVRLDMSTQALPLAKVLEGGTWAAGRRIAKSLRPDGAPPIRVESDGTVF